MRKITPCLWFDTQAQEAAKFYVSVFKNSKLGPVTRYGEGMPMPKGTVMTAWFTIDGQEFMGLNGGPAFKFTPAVSLMVMCKTQAEIDRLWAKLSSGGGQEVECGWVTDKYGLSWQIVPANLEKLLTKSPAQAQRVMAAVMKMKKLDIKTLEDAAKGK